MPYITTAQYDDAFGNAELADLTAQSGIEFAIAEASAASLINGYLASRYTLPLAEVPDMVRGWALDITRYRLWSDQAPEEVRRRYEDALQQLRDLAARKIDLPPGSNGIAPASGFVIDGYSAARVFTDDAGLKGF
jgi:phage gp36-like protein